MQPLRSSLSFCIVLTAMLPALSALAAGENLAAGRPYQISVAPNYRLCTGESDARDLTDGRMGQGQIWIDQGTVGWNRASEPILITVDLGKVQPIDGVAIHMAAGGAGVSWPRSVAAFVSDDGQAFRFAVELMTASNDLPPTYGKAIDHTFRATGLATAGRYVHFALVPSGIFAFCDEVEVYAGSSAHANNPAAGPAVGVDELTAPARLTKLGVQQRLLRDLAEVEQRLNASALSAAQRRPIEAEISTLRNATRDLPAPEDPERFRAILPLNDLHRKIFALHGRLLHIQDAPALTLWQTHRYAPLAPFDQPTGAAPQLHVEMAKSEHRAAAFNLTNASPEPRELILTFHGLPGGPMPEGVRVMEAQFVDTAGGRAVCSALTPAPRTASGYRIRVPAGMTRQVWLSFHAPDAAPGRYTGRVQLRAADFERDVPLTWIIAPVEIPPAEFGFQMWDYAVNESRGITAANRDAAIADMRDHGVNVPWALRRSAPWPKPADFDADGRLTGTPVFKTFDAFVGAWPDALRYMIFLSVAGGEKFGGIDPGTEQFDRAVGEWAHAWAEHVRKLGLKPGQVTLLLVDEPRSPAQWLTTLQWARAIKQATDVFAIFVDPISAPPATVEYAVEALRYCDIVSPKRSEYERGDEGLRSFYQAFAQESGKALWLYSCAGPTRSFSAAYFRLQPWRGFEAGATGSGFWAYGDTGGTPNGWNPYASIGRDSYTPVYLDPASVTTSKHWEAAREGVQDYALLAALANQTSPEQARQVARHLFERAQAEFGHSFYTDSEAAAVHDWTDEARLAALHTLVKQAAAVNASAPRRRASGKGQ